MLSESRGFFLVEVLLSLVIWIFITGSFIPIYIKVSNQSMNIKKETEAINLLYEAIQTSIMEGSPNINETIIRGGKEYSIIWYRREDLSLEKVCVKFESEKGEWGEKCEQVEW